LERLLSYLLSDDAKMLRDSAEKFFAGSDAIKLTRQWRNARDLEAAARGAWTGMVELGFTGTLIPEELGGVGLNIQASLQIAEMMGKSLAGGPYVSSAVMAATAILAGNNDAVKAELLPAIAGGKVVALATEENGRHKPHAIETVARRDGADFRITGRKTTVIDGNIADALIVVARDHDSYVMLVADTKAPGIAVTSRPGMDSRPLVDIVFEDTVATDRVCDQAETLAVLDRAYDCGRLHLAAEMLGAAQECFDRAVEYLKTRVQFGKKIGEFQALQHRAAILLGELEIARSVVLKAAASPTPEFVSMAKARVGDIAKKAALEAIQFHGGIGVTDDFDLGFYLKRIRTAAELLGDSAFHAERYAGIRGL
jgi:alkylation response protein AidB-like acyl-CoA dehydrogenase